jgi:hypothetical protein
MEADDALRVLVVRPGRRRSDRALPDRRRRYGAQPMSAWIMLGMVVAEIVETILIVGDLTGRH